jgi:iron(III) transport system permease protein
VPAGRVAVRARRGSGAPPAVLVLPALLAAAVAVVPIAYLLVRATEGGAQGLLEVLWRERTAALVLRSLGLAAAVTAACLVLGVSLAWLTTRSNLPGRRAWGLLAALPLAVPSYVAAFAWVSAAPGLAGFTGSLLVLTACTYPYVYLPVAAAMSRTDPAAEEVARSLGRSATATFLTVTLRQVRPAAAAGSLLVGLYVLSDFGAVSILRYDVFTRVIFSSYRSSFDRTPAAVLSLLLVVITVLITVAESRSRGAAGQARLGSGVARTPALVGLGRWRPAALAWCGAVAAVALGFPAASLGFWVWRGQSSGFELDRLVPAALATLGVSALGALVTTVLAVPVGVLAARYRGRGTRLVEHATYAGHALPGIVVALALVFFGIRVVPGVYQRTPLLVLGYAVLFLPAAVGAVRASVAQSPPRLEELARSLGRGPLGVLRQVTLPLAAPGVAAGAALVMLTCMKELPATLLLRPTGVDTLATRLWSETGVAAYGAAAPYAVLLVVLAAVPTFLLSRWQSRLVGGDHQVATTEEVP